jgi:excisionase family DNA binding protein
LSTKICNLTNSFEDPYKNAVTLLTTKDAAVRLGVSQRRVIALIQGGRLPAQKVGRDYVIAERDLKLVSNRKPGRPRKRATTRTVRKPKSNR